MKRLDNNDDNRKMQATPKHAEKTTQDMQIGLTEEGGRHSWVRNDHTIFVEPLFHVNLE